MTAGRGRRPVTAQERGHVIRPPPPRPLPQASRTSIASSSPLPSGGDQLLEESIHQSVEELHPRNGGAGGHRFRTRPFRPLFLTSSLCVDAARCSHIEAGPPNLTGSAAPPTEAPDWLAPALGASGWRRRVSITEPRWQRRAPHRRPLWAGGPTTRKPVLRGSIKTFNYTSETSYSATVNVRR